MIQEGLEYLSPILLLDWLSFLFAFHVTMIVITRRIRNYLIMTVLGAFNRT